MRSCRLNKQVLASLVGTVIVVWLLGSIPDDGSYPGKMGIVALAARNGGYYTGATLPDKVVAAGHSRSKRMLKQGGAMASYDYFFNILQRQINYSVSRTANEKHHLNDYSEQVSPSLNAYIVCALLVITGIHSKPPVAWKAKSWVLRHDKELFHRSLLVPNYIKRSLSSTPRMKNVLEG
ncbi:hypothetical protein AVEN_209929-1 [Araneus ventricosus]|uniref:Uncharacterized protein n=1 Tax=Araneus ventricosus TaxID=182803 RepID=A0A4Y2DB55_ARAVE|nr:hypothetical protein AVEN_209929-1 [Araneus ventricosus]